MCSYNVSYTKRAERDIKNFTVSQVNEIRFTINNALRKEPYDNTGDLHGELRRFRKFRLRINNNPYRAIIYIDDEQRLVTIHSIHRVMKRQKDYRI